MDTLIIDAYNVINFWEKTSEHTQNDLDHARSILNNALQNYASYKGINVIVIYDAYKTDKKLTSKSEYENIQIIYTKQGQTADAFIEELIFEFKNKDDIFVVTSDWTLQQMVLSSGLIRIPVSELISDITRIEKQLSEKYEKNNHSKSEAQNNHILMDKLKDLKE
jgi:hypothetical protein